jgi:hypothetical protein
MGSLNDYTAQQSCYPSDIFPPINTNGISLCQGAVTNLLPSLLTQLAASYTSGWWVTISETNANNSNTDIQAGRVSYLVVNLSGMMDVHALDTNKLAALGEGLTAYNRTSPTGAYQRVFLTQPDLTAANNGAVSNLVTFSYDPGPEVFFAYTNLPSIGTYAFGGMLSNRFNINSATQYVGNYDSAAFQANWLTPVSNLLADAGLPASDQVAWNILNYLDPGRTPVVAAGSPPAYRTGYGVKDVPMINRVSLEPINANPEYGVSVELWYPFVPNPAPDKVWLWVGVYTNDSFLADAQTAIANLGDPPLSPMSFKVLVPTQMNYGGAAEFYVGATTNLPAPPLPISFKELVPFPLPPTTVYHVIGKDYPVWIWPRVYVEDAPGHLVCVDEALVCGNLPTRWEGAGCIQYGDPRTNQCGAAMVDATSGLTLVATNANCSIPSLPLVHADAPMRSAGELRHIYAPGLPGGRIDFTTRLGGAVRDRFTTLATNAPVHGLVNANTPYTNIWQALLSDVTIGWTNQIHPGDCSGSIGARLDQASQVALASTVANALLNTGGRGWVCNEEMYPLVGSNLLGNVITTNSVGDMDARAVCGDILAGISDRVSFRGNSFLVIVCGQRLSPLGRVLADQRAACTVVRDAFTGRWVVDHVVWLTE